MAATAFSTVAWPVTSTTGKAGRSAWTSSMRVRPSRSGILRSVTSARGSHSDSRCSASPPEAAVTTSNPSSERLARATLRVAGSSSTSSTSSALIVSSRAPLRLDLGGRRGSPHRAHREAERGHRPAAWPIRQGEAGAVLIGRAAHDDEAEAGAARLGGDEGARHLLQLVGRDAGAAVLHLHHHRPLTASRDVAARQL